MEIIQAHKVVEALLRDQEDYSVIIKQVNNSQKFFLGELDEIPSHKDIEHFSLPYNLTYWEGVSGEGEGPRDRIGCLCSETKEGEITLLPLVNLVAMGWVKPFCKIVHQRGGPVAIHRLTQEALQIPKNVITEMAGNITSKTISFLQLMECKNIFYTESIPPNKLQKKRKRKKKIPFFSFYTLHIKQEGNSYAPPRGGSHASPRVHLRRGHIRRLGDSRTTWVQPCVVGDKQRGAVLKDYAVSI